MLQANILEAKPIDLCACYEPMFEAPADLDQDNSKIAALFEGSL